MSSLQCPDFIKKKTTQIPRGFSIWNWAAIFYLKFKLSAIVSTIFDSQPPFLPSGVLYVNGVWLKLVALFEIQSQRCVSGKFEFIAVPPQGSASKIIQLLVEEAPDMGFSQD